MRHRLPVLLALCALAWTTAKAEEAVLDSAIDRMFRMDYAAAEETLLAGLPDTAPARAYFAGMIHLNRFLDLGDTAALTRAETWWAPLTPSGAPAKRYAGADPEELRLYRGLTGFQLAHVVSLRGSSLKAAMLAFSARRQLAPLEAPEARATLLLYDYWRGRILERIPLVQAAEFPLKEFEAARAASGRLRTPFRFALFWILLDTERPAAGLELVEEFLLRYPDHRLAREMRGVALYRLGRLKEARAEHEKLLKEYIERDREAPCPACLPLGRYRAEGNLARICAVLGLPEEAAAHRTQWNRAVESGLSPWLPASLKRDLERLEDGAAER